MWHQKMCCNWLTKRRWNVDISHKKQNAIIYPVKVWRAYCLYDFCLAQSCKRLESTSLDMKTATNSASCRTLVHQDDAQELDQSAPTADIDTFRHTISTNQSTDQIDPFENDMPELYTHSFVVYRVPTVVTKLIQGLFKDMQGLPTLIFKD